METPHNAGNGRKAESMMAKYTETNVNNATNYGDKKETTGSLVLVVKDEAGGLRSQGFEGHILFPSVRCGFQHRTLRLRYGIVNMIVAVGMAAFSAL